MTKRALTGASVFDGTQLHENAALLLDGDLFDGITTGPTVPEGYEDVPVSEGTILPGFVDLQVNGGGGVMFNDETSVEGLRAIAAAHASIGTRALLPTLITDTPERTSAAVNAVEEAIAQGVPGIIGVHLEGPHLSISRKGAHDPELIRPMEEADEVFLCDAARRLPNIMVTVAPENVTPAQIRKLSEAGVIMSLGHSDCSYMDAKNAFAAGARCVTHLYNAMSQIGNREPGLVGAALDTSGVSAGLIADDIHVHASNMRVALMAKRQPGAVFLVTDAMSTAGSEITGFTLNGRTVTRENGRLTLQDGTLAGADLDFPTAISILVNKVGVASAQAFSMATSIPASCLKTPGTAGRFELGRPVNAIHLGDDLNFRAAV